jgi:hypothetical protein
MYQTSVPIPPFSKVPSLSSNNFGGNKRMKEIKKSEE